MNTPEQAVGDLAIGLGMLMAAEHCAPTRQPAYECFVESVLVLAHKAGVPRQKALQPFDMHHLFAEKTWDALDSL